jgi:hypothetical protein
MPTPEQIQQSSLFINELYQELELELLTNIGRKLATNQTITQDNVLQWQVTKLQQLGPLQEEQIKTIARASGKTPEAVKAWIREIGFMAVNEIEAGMAAALPGATVTAVSQSNVLLGTLLLFEQNAINTMNLVNTTLLSSSQQVYIDIVNKSTAEVLTGLSTHDQAMRKVAKQWAEKGVPALIDKAGKRWSTEAYVNMVTRSISSQVAAKAQESRMDEYNIDLVEISSHVGSRPSHFEYQGNIYSRSGRAKRYPALASTTYGKIDGIITGINCGHQFYPFVNGKSIRRPNPYDKRQSEKLYKESQRQRSIEREIRAGKKELRMMEAMKDETGIKEAKQNIRMKQAKMRRFIDMTGRTRRYKREQIV